MRAYRIDQFGSVDGVVLGSRDDPRPGPRSGSGDYFPFEAVPDAYRYFESRAHFGKVVISHG
jgi:hypothetical protein